MNLVIWTIFFLQRYLEDTIIRHAFSRVKGSMLSGIYLFTQVLIALTMLSNWDGIQQQIYIFGLFPLVGMAYIGELIIIASDSGKDVNFSKLFTPII